MPVCLCACVPVCLCACVPVYLFLWLSVYLYLCLFVYLSLFLSLFSYPLPSFLLPTFIVSVFATSFQKETCGIFLCIALFFTILLLATLCPPLHLLCIRINHEFLCLALFFHSQNLILIHCSGPLSVTSFCSLSSVVILETIHFTYLLGEKQITTSFLLETSAVHLSPVKLTASGLLLETFTVHLFLWKNNTLLVSF